MSTTKVDAELIEDGAPNTVVAADSNGERVEVPLTTLSTRIGLTLVGTMDNNTETILTIEPGKITHQDGTRTIELTTTLTKDITSTWAQGDGNGAWDVTPNLTIQQGISVYLIENDTTSDIDVLVANSRSVAVPPTGWSIARRIGYVCLTNTGTMMGFEQRGNRFTLRSVINNGANTAFANRDTVVTQSMVHFPDDATISTRHLVTLRGGNGGAFIRAIQEAGAPAPSPLRLLWPADSNVPDANSTQRHDVWMYHKGNTVMDVYIRTEYNGVGGGNRGYNMLIKEWIDHDID